MPEEQDIDAHHNRDQSQHIKRDRRLSSHPPDPTCQRFAEAAPAVRHRAKARESLADASSTSAHDDRRAAFLSGERCGSLGGAAACCKARFGRAYHSPGRMQGLVWASVERRKRPEPSKLAAWPRQMVPSSSDRFDLGGRAQRPCNADGLQPHRPLFAPAPSNTAARSVWISSSSPAASRGRGKRPQFMVKREHG